MAQVQAATKLTSAKKAARRATTPYSSGSKPTPIRLFLTIACKFKAQQQCEFSKEEFLGGMLDLGFDGIDKLKQKLSSLEKEIMDQNKFKEFYQFTFNYARTSARRAWTSRWPWPIGTS